MYKCNECGHLFEEGEQKVYREKMGECHGFPAYENFSVCPNCGGDYEEAQACKICGTYEDVDGDFCMECEANVKKKIQPFLKTLTPEEIELLNKLYDGEEICIEE